MLNYEYEPVTDPSFIPNAILKISSVQFDATEGDESLFDTFFDTLDSEKGITDRIKERNAESWDMTSECVLKEEK